ncbi:MAG TPA: hypothetical protein VFF68_05780 [Anaerolineaceae bacterium]|nr:hypothetical protein [Anaerolineaceae bacterium]
MRKNNRPLIYFWLGVLIVAVLLAPFSPAQAASVLSGPQPQVTEEPPLPGVTQPVPETGGEQTTETGALGSWVLWVFLAIVVLGLIIALATRGSSTR